MKYAHKMGLRGLVLILLVVCMLASCKGKPSAEKPTVEKPAAEKPAAAEPAAPAVKIALRNNRAEKWGAETDKLAGEAYDAGVLATGAAAGGGRNKVRQLYSFEDSKTGTHDIDGKRIPYMSNSERMETIYVADNGVTDGKWCARMTVPPGRYAGLQVSGDILKGWEEYDYVAIDVFVNEDKPMAFTFEVWDGASKNYATRCTWEDSAEFKTHQGAQTMYYHLARAVRNSKKEGRSWEQLAEADKIDVANLTKFKLILQGNEEHSTMYWVDNIRLMQEDAVKPTLNIDLPKGARAFNFGDKGTVIAGFEGVNPESQGVNGKVASGGKGWPDLLAGTYLRAGADEEFGISVAVPDGEYKMWLCAGPILDASKTSPKFLLQAGDKVLFSAEPSFEEYDSVQFLYRFMWTQYSRRPHALWLDYINTMFPVYSESVKVTGGKLDIKAMNFFLSGVILCPADKERDFQRMEAKIKKTRMESFEKGIFWPSNSKHPEGNYAGDYALFIPDRLDNVGPATLPPANARHSIAAAGTAGQSVIMTVAIAPYKDLGAGELRLSNLVGADGLIGAQAITGNYVNYKFTSTGVQEIAMIPSLAMNMEQGITAHFILWLEIPEDARPGKYAGEFEFVSEKAAAHKVPVKLEVYPFKLVEDLPLSAGMYYSGRYLPRPPAEKKWEVIGAQFKAMRKLGLTASGVVNDYRVGRIDAANKTVEMTFDDTCWKLMKAAGLGRQEDQLQLASYQLSIARNIARRTMPWDKEKNRTAPVDQVPGCELSYPPFKPMWVNAMTKYSDFLESTGLPYMVWSVDEPRPVPNAWNRTVEDSITYLDWMGEIGMKNRMMTPMADRAGGVDNIQMTAHCEVMTPHGNKSCAGLIKATHDQGKILHFYNCGMSRLSWGFMVWQDKSKGRWQWHWSFSDGSSYEGYPGSEWYSPFTKQNAYATNAPIAEYPGGMVYKSKMMNIVLGLNDFAYLVTLEAAIADAKKSAENAAGVAKAEALLKEILDEMPQFPLDEGYEETSAKLSGWRVRLAEALKKL